jgi:hypothetical protein
MKKFFTTVLILNFLIEGLAAISLISAPGAMFPEGQTAGIDWVRNYAFAALALSTIVFWIWPHRSNLKVVTTVLGYLLTFQACILTSLVISGQQMAGVVIHSVMLVLCLVLFILRKKWCTE